MSLELASLICRAVMESVRTRVVRYSSLAVMLFWKVTFRPASGANDSLMLTVLMSYMDEGM